MNTIDIETLGIRRASSTQLGNYYLCGTRDSVTAYKIVSYQNNNPKLLTLVGATRNIDGMSWDDAYDAIVGKPLAPNFNEVVNV